MSNGKLEIPGEIFPSYYDYRFFLLLNKTYEASLQLIDISISQLLRHCWALKSLDSFTQ